MTQVTVPHAVRPIGAGVVQDLAGEHQNAEKRPEIGLRRFFCKKNPNKVSYYDKIGINRFSVTIGLAAYFALQQKVIAVSILILHKKTAALDCALKRAI